MKKVLSFLLLVLMVAGTGCGSCKGNENNGGNPNDPSNPAGPNEPVVNFSDVAIVDNGTTDYQIVIPTEANECEEFSAEHLQSYLYKSTGVTLPIVNDSGKTFHQNNKYISLGNTSVKEGAGITVTNEEVYQDGYKMVRKGNNLIIASYRDYGTMYGVFEFLKICIDYEVYALDTIVYEEMTKLYLPDVDFVDQPSFLGRNMDGPISESAELQALLRMRANRHSTGKYGTLSYQDDWMGRTSETYYLYLPVGNKNADGTWDSESNAAKHPRWFTHQGDSITDRQLCYTNKECQDEMVKLIEQYIVDHPDGKWVNISMNDGNAFCQCDEDKDRELSWNGLSCKESCDLYTLSGTHVRWVNEVIRQVEIWRKANYPDRDIKYTAFAYQWLYPAPVKMNSDGTYSAIDDSCIPCDELYMRWTPLNSCFYHEITDDSCGTNKSYASAIKGWASICDHFNVYDYRANFTNYFPFYNNFNAVQNNMKFYKSIGVTDYMIQAASGAKLTSLCDLNSYLNAKLLWDVNEDFEGLINDFMDNYYGVAAPYMKDYLTRLRTHFAGLDNEKDNYHQKSYNNTTVVAYWPLGLVEKCLSLFDEANAAIEKAYDSQTASKYKTHILKESICVRSILLQNYASYYTKGSAEYNETLAQFKQDVDLIGVGDYREGLPIKYFYDSLE